MSAEYTGLINSYTVSASAGFGKTEDLTLRMAELLLWAAEPAQAVRELVAMTFTRAAAGEIFERLLAMIYRALLQENGVALLSERMRKAAVIKQMSADELSRVLQSDTVRKYLQSSGISDFPPELKAYGNVTLPECNPERLSRILQILAANMTLLNSGTIDSFMYKIVQSYPFELGLPGRAELMTDSEKDLRYKQLIMRLFTVKVDSAEFTAACREILAGQEKKRFFDFAEELLGELLSCSDMADTAAPWGKYRNYYPPENSCGLSVAKAEEIWRNYLNTSDYGKVISRKSGGGSARIFSEMLLKTAHLSAENGLIRAELDKLNTALNCWRDFPKIKNLGFVAKLDEYLQTAVKRLLLEGAAWRIRESANLTFEMRNLLTAFLQEYDRAVLALGKLSFDDLPRLLNNTANDWAADVGFRLNTQMRHWLLDEFQDTNSDQLAVLNRIIDTVVPGENSLYLVGDVKQAIYGWRGGNRHLMKQETEEMCLQPSFLPFSYRYGKEICDALNHCFGRIAMRHGGLPENVQTEWNAIWQPHYSAVARPGYCEVLGIVDERLDANTSPILAYAQMTAVRLAELNVVEHNLSCAILVRNNKTGIELKEQLTQLLPQLAERLVWEGDETIAADPLIAGILALLVYIQHPGDTLSQFAAKLNQVLKPLLPKTSDDLKQANQRLALCGINGTIRYYLSRLHNLSVLNFAGENMEYSAAGNLNIATLLEAARAFDCAEAGGDTIKFRNFVRTYKRRETALPGTIKLMTIHKSKGLTFDVVFAPMLTPGGGMALNINAPKVNGVLRGNKMDNYLPEYVLYNPGPAVFTVNELAGDLQIRHNEQIFEALCLNYVALTRARLAMVVILPPLSKEKRRAVLEGEFISSLTGESYYVNDFMYDAVLVDSAATETEVAEWQVITRSWGSLAAVAEYAPSGKPAEAVNNIMPITFTAGQRRLQRAEPSEHAAGIMEAWELPSSTDSAQIGTEIHEIFAHILDLKTFKISENYPKYLKKHLYNAQSNPQICALVNADADQIWRETPFEILLDSRWISGRFDRVNIYTAPSGMIDRVEVIDYKSDYLPDDTDLAIHSDRYMSQMQLYRRAAAKLTGVDAAMVKVYLIYTNSGRIHDCFKC